MVRFSTFGRNPCSLWLSSGSVSPVRALGLAVALVRRCGLPRLCFEADGLGAAWLSAWWSSPRSAWLSVRVPRLLPWLLRLRWRVVCARRDPFCPAPNWFAAVWCSVTAPLSEW